MSSVKWTICIATIPHRKEKLAALMDHLTPQVKKAKGKVEIVIFYNNFEYSMGYLRQQLIESARGQYVSHIDDDDWVPDDFVERILPLLDGVDYIGFKVKLYNNGEEMAPVYHSLRYHDWHQDGDGYYRRITHLNPLKRRLALDAGFRAEHNMGEDEDWAHRVKASSEHFIDDYMYFYMHETQKLEVPRHDTPKRPEFSSRYVRLHPRSTRGN